MKPRINPHIVLFTLIATLGGLLFGYDTAVISGAVGSLKAHFIEPRHLADPDAASTLWGFVNSSALIGCIIGGVTGGWLSTRIGRKRGLVVAAVLFLVSAIGAAAPELPFAWVGQGGPGDYMWNFVFYRILSGIGVGLASMLSPMYIAEIAPARIRGNLVAWNQFAIIFGMLVIYFVNYGISKMGTGDVWLNSIGWRYMFLSGTIPAAAFLLLLLLVPETPRYLMLKGDEAGARAVLAKIGTAEEGEAEIAEIRASLSEHHSGWMFSFGALIIAIGIMLLVYTFFGRISLWWPLLVTFIGIVLSVFGRKELSSGSKFGLLISIGIMLSVFQQFVGINVVLYYAPEIFKNVGFDTNASLFQTIIVGAVNLIFTVVAILTVDKLGRKPLQIIGALVMAVAMIALGTAFARQIQGLTALMCMLLYIAGFAVSWGPVVWVLLSEIFPNQIRGPFMAVAVAAQWIANYVVSSTFPILNDNPYLLNHFHHGFAYWIYGGMSLLAALLMWVMVPETKGKTLEQMEKLWLKPKAQ